MARFSFCGPTYQSESVNADAQRSINLYPESVESGQGRTAYAMYPRPGLIPFVTLAGESEVPQLFQQNGRMFAAGLFLWEVFSNGTAVQRGALNPALGAYITITANQNQLLVLSNGNLYVMNLTTNVVTPVNMTQFNGPISQISFCDSFFLAVQQNSQNFYTSNLLDGTTWLAVNAAQISLITDNIVSHIVSHRDVWFFGSKSSIVYYNSGAALAPFIPISGAFVEQGSNAVAGPSRANNSIFWTGQDERGALVAYMANAYTPQRVSNHAVENQWQSYKVTSDLITFSCEFNGHIWWVLYFPTQNVTWVYDMATQMWHEWSYLDPIHGPVAFRGQCHCFAFGQHFVGDSQTGTIYQISIQNLTDFGTPIQKLRRAPAVSKELEWIQHYQMQLDVESGLGPIPPIAATSPPTYIVLEDSSGQLWNVGISDIGSVTTTQVAPQINPQPTPQTVVLSDIDNSGSYWLLGITTLGVLTTQLVAVQPLPGYAIPPTVKYQVSLIGSTNAQLFISGPINNSATPLALNLTGGSVPIATPVSVTGGVTLLVAILASRGGPATITDSLSNNWEYLPAYTDPVTGITVQVAYVSNPILSAQDIFTLANQNESSAVVYAFTGTLQANGVLDMTAGVASLLASPFKPGSISPTAGDLVISGFAGASQLLTSPTINDSFSASLTAGSAGTAAVAGAYLLNAPSTALNPTWTSPEAGVPFIVSFFCPSAVVGVTTGPIPNTYQLISGPSGGNLWNLQITSLGVLSPVSAGTVSRPPQVYLRWSDDGGHNYSNAYARSFGDAGDFLKRVIWRRLGRSRNRVYEISCTDAVPFRIVDAYLKASGEFQAQERLVQSYRKVG
jgi:hypothetical protein